MAHLVPINYAHYRDLHRVALETEPYSSGMSYTEFVSALRGSYEGWAVEANGQVVGAVVYSDYAPGQDIILHVNILPEYRGKWVNRSMLRQAFEFPFVTLGLNRVSGYCIPGLSDYAGEMLVRLGFTCEGERREIVNIAGKLRNVMVFGMLKRECRWL